MGVYLEDLTYKEILPILARTGKLIDTRKIIEIDLTRCGECKHKIQALSTEQGATSCELIRGTFYEDFFCKCGERRSE